MPGDIKERFGRYYILDHLVNGGMAKICRARFLGEQADRIVAIKMVQPQFSSDESFKQMFMDEIKVTFGLLHPNIVQTYDYGLHKEQLFVAMEYCDGRNLKEYLTRLKEKKFVFPVEISIYIMSQVCQGLHYAHRFTDKLTGKAANIIHRDISPHNIMLTYDGSVKVIDFGIAKAETNSESTQAGTIKGKLSYLAPEYLEGLDLDARYDIFSVGISLWEMLCSQKLFKAKNDLAVLKKIQECTIPAPSTINPNVPKELDDIVLKALAKDRNNRYEDIDQLNRALIKFLYANYPDFNSSDLSYFAKELFKEEIQKDREKLFEYGKINLKPFIEEWKNESQGKGKSSSSQVDVEGTLTKKEEKLLDFGFEAASTRTRKKAGVAVSKPKAGAEGTKLRIDRSSLVKKRNNRSNAYGAKDQADLNMNESNATHTSFSDSTAGSSRYIKFLKVVVSVAGLAFVANVYRDDVVKWLDIPELNKFTAKAPKNVDLEEEAIVVKKARLKNYDSEIHKAFINGKRVKPDFLKEITLPSGEDFTVRVEAQGRKHFIKTIDITNVDYVNIEIPLEEEIDFGYLYTSRGCQMEGKIYFELWGESRVEKLVSGNTYGVALPVMGDGRYPASVNGTAAYTIYFQKEGESIQRKLEFNFSKVGERIDLCDI
jgi:serine/threonine-protein kinase